MNNREKAESFARYWRHAGDASEANLVSCLRAMLDETVEQCAARVECHSCVSSCSCGAQPGGQEAKLLATCVRLLK